VAAHAVAYVRGGDIVAVAPRLVIGLAGDWGGTRLVLPEGRFEDVLDGGKRTFTGEVALADLLGPFPVALLERAP
jgi:(1->4)-alpha-D-glucan 1-alpha-D-glucosylmutase